MAEQAKLTETILLLFLKGLNLHLEHILPRAWPSAGPACFLDGAKLIIVQMNKSDGVVSL